MTFLLDARLLRRGLLEKGDSELAISGQHTMEEITQLTADPLVAQFPGQIRHV